jgi:hypothetical protein
MKSKVSAVPNGAPLYQFFQFQGKLTPAAARALLKFGFSEHDQARMEELSTKAGAGTLTPPEQTELDAYERLDCVLSVIHSRARQALQKLPQRAS